MPKQIKIIIGVAAVVLGLGILLFLAQPKVGGNNDPAHANMADMDKEVSDMLGVSEKLHDFGTISMKDGKVTNIFKVKNTQNDPLTLKKLYTSCMCTDASLKVGDRTEGPFGMLGHGFIPTFSQNLPPNGEAEVVVTFDPNAHGPAGVGVIEREVTLEGQQGPVATMKIKANVIP